MRTARGNHSQATESTDSFSNQATNPNFAAPIAEHAKWAFKHFYSQENISSPQGIVHVSRTAIYVPVFVNLYRRHGDQEALALTNDDIKLLQIIVLLHHESIEMTYLYLTKNLNINEAKARQLADANANKYADINTKNIYQKILYDAATLEEIQVDLFEGSRLDFFKSYAYVNDQALDEMGKLITEVRSLIEVHGDTPNKKQPNVRKLYQCADAYTKILGTVFDVKKNGHSKNYKVLQYFYNQGNIFSDEKMKQKFILLDPIPQETGLLSQQKAQALLEHGLLFSRSIQYPSATYYKHKSDETLTEVEIRKTLRRLHHTTRSGKTNKEGNFSRSISTIGGTPTYDRSGFIIAGELNNPVKAISAVDNDSGRMKKELWNSKPALSDADKQEQFAQLNRQQKIGGIKRVLKDGTIFTHTEIIYDVTDFHAVIFSVDCSRQSSNNHTEYPAQLEAIFDQIEYKKPTQVTLPIFHFSNIHNEVTRIPEYTDKQILDIWAKACYELTKQNPDKFINMSVTNLKILCTYEKLQIPYKYEVIKGIMPKLMRAMNPMDCNYSKALQEKVSSVVDAVRNKTINDHINAIRAEIISSNTIFAIPILSLFRYTKLLAEKEVQAHLQTKIFQALSSDLFMQEIPPLEELFNGFSGSNALTEKLFTKNKVELMLEEWVPSFLQNRIAKIYVLAVKMNFRHEVNLIQRQALRYLKAMIKKEESNIYRNYIELIAIAAMFDVYDSVRKNILKLFFGDKSNRGLRDRSLITVMGMYTKKSLTLEEAYYFKKIADLDRISIDTQNKFLATWNGNSDFSDYIKYRDAGDNKAAINIERKYPFYPLFFDHKTNRQLHNYLKSHGLFRDEQTRKISYRKACEPNRVEYRNFVTTLLKN